MIETSFEVRFRITVDDYDAFLQQLKTELVAMPGVAQVAADADRYGFARIDVNVRFEGTKEGMSLHNRMMDAFIARHGILLSGIGYSLTDMFKNDNRSEKQ